MKFVWGQALECDATKGFIPITCAVKVDGLLKRSTAKVAARRMVTLYIESYLDSLIENNLALSPASGHHIYRAWVTQIINVSWDQ